MSGKAPRLTDLYNELRSEANTLRARMDELKANERVAALRCDEIKKRLKELGVEDPDDEESIKAKLFLAKKDLLSCIKMKLKEVKRAIARLEPGPDAVS